jgi:hypothetical protein
VFRTEQGNKEKVKRQKEKVRALPSLPPQYDLVDHPTSSHALFFLRSYFSFFLLPSSVVHYPAVSQLDYPVAIGGIYLRMGYLNNSCSGLVEPLEQLHNFFALVRM